MLATPRARRGFGLLGLLGLLWLHGMAAAAAVDTVPRLQTHADPVALEAARQNPRQYAVAVSVNAGLADGQWVTTGDQRIWRLRVRAEGASAIAVHLD